MAHPARAFVIRRTLLSALVSLVAYPATAAPPPAPVVTILGDSITAGLGLQAADALPAQLQVSLLRRGIVAEVRGAGVSGDTTAGGLARMDFSVQPDTRVCVIELGGNDYLQSTPAAETKRNLLTIIARLRARRIRVVVCSVTPPGKASGAYGEEVAAFFRGLKKMPGISVSPDLLVGVLGDPAMKQPDGIHPNIRGVRIVAERLAPVVARALRS